MSNGTILRRMKGKMFTHPSLVFTLFPTLASINGNRSHYPFVMRLADWTLRVNAGNLAADISFIEINKPFLILGEVEVDKNFFTTPKTVLHVLYGEKTGLIVCSSAKEEYFLTLAVHHCQGRIFIEILWGEKRGWICAGKPDTQLIFRKIGDSVSSPKQAKHL